MQLYWERELIIQKVASIEGNYICNIIVGDCTKSLSYMQTPFGLLQHFEGHFLVLAMVVDVVQHHVRRRTEHLHLAIGEFEALRTVYFAATIFAEGFGGKETGIEVLLDHTLLDLSFLEGEIALGANLLPVEVLEVFFELHGIWELLLARRTLLLA